MNDIYRNYSDISYDKAKVIMEKEQGVPSWLLIYMSLEDFGRGVKAIPK